MNILYTLLIATTAILKVLFLLDTTLIHHSVRAFLLVMLCIAGVIWFWYKLMIWAKKRKAGAVIFGAAVQMLLPDPYAERTIKIVQERKQENKKQQQQKDKLPDD